MATPIEGLIPNSDDAPHRCVIWVEAEVHELLPTGECSGMPKHRVERFPLAVDGGNRSEAIRKLNALLAEVKEKCR